MLYTFTLTEDQLDRVTDYLDRVYGLDHRQYILAVQPQLWEDLILVVVDCTEATAVYIELLI